MKYLATLAMVLGLGVAAQAAQITGGISLSGDYAVNGGGNLNSATAFTSFTDVQVTSVAGDFSGAGIIVGTAGTVTMTPFGFNPFPAGGVVPLWITTAGTLASFDLLSLTSRLQPGDNTLTLKGTGNLHLDGYDITAGEWIFTANTLGGTFSWSSSNGSVPDGGVTLMLLGGALTGLALIRRKLA